MQHPKMEQSPEGVMTTAKEARQRRFLLPMGLLVMAAGVCVAIQGALTITYELGQRALQLRAKGMTVSVGGAVTGRVESFGEAFFQVPFSNLGDTAIRLTLLGQGATYLLWTGALLAIGMFMIRARRQLFDRVAQRWLTAAITCAMVATAAGGALVTGGTNAALGDLGLSNASAAGNDLLIWGGLLAAYILTCLRVAIALGAAQQDELSAVV